MCLQITQTFHIFGVYIVEFYLRIFLLNPPLTGGNYNEKIQEMKWKSSTGKYKRQGYYIECKVNNMELKQYNQ